jgi:predicted RNA binding protein YcfA (HicA-like mRNA interferase family)
MSGLKHGTKLPVVSGRELAKALAIIGYLHDHQKGSHIILRQQNPPHRRLTIPDHKEIAKGTLKNILREAGLTMEELLHLL